MPALLLLCSPTRLVPSPAPPPPPSPHCPGAVPRQPLPNRGKRPPAQPTPQKRPSFSPAFPPGPEAGAWKARLDPGALWGQRGRRPEGSGQGAVPTVGLAEGQAQTAGVHRARYFVSGTACQPWICFHSRARSWQLAWEWLSVFCPCPFLPASEGRHRWWWQGPLARGLSWAWAAGRGLGLSDVTQAQLQLSGRSGRGLIPRQDLWGSGGSAGRVSRGAREGALLGRTGAASADPRGAAGACASLEGREAGQGHSGQAADLEAGYT